MLSFIASVLLTFALMRMYQFVMAMPGFQHVALLAAISGILYLAYRISPMKDRWVILSKKDGSPLGRGWLATLSIGTAASLLLLLWVAGFNWLITAALLFVLIAGRKELMKYVSGVYKSKKEKKMQQIVDLRNAKEPQQDEDSVEA